MRRALPFTFTTALGAKPPPFTVSVNSGPPVATICGEIEVISTPVPVRFGLGVVTATEAVTLRLADSALAGRDGVNVRLASQDAPEASGKGTAVGQAEFPSPFETKATIWKSPGLAPAMEKADVTLTEEAVALVRVAFMVGLVVPTGTAPKFTGERNTSPAPAVRGTPVIGIACGLPEPLSVRFSVATLLALPGVTELAKYVIPKLQVPPPAASVTVPVPVCPLVGKLQLVPVVGVAKEKLARFVPVML